MATRGALYNKVQPIKANFNSTEKILQWAMSKSAEKHKQMLERLKMAVKSDKEYVENVSEWLDKFDKADAEGKWNTELDKVYNKLYPEFAKISKQIVKKEKYGLLDDEYMELRRKAEKIIAIPDQIAKGSESVFNISTDFYKGIKEKRYSSARNQGIAEKIGRATYQGKWSIDYDDDYNLHVSYPTKKENGDIEKTKVRMGQFQLKPFGVSRNDFAAYGDPENLAELADDIVDGVQSDEDFELQIGTDRDDIDPEKERVVLEITTDRFSEKKRTASANLFREAAQKRYPNAIKEMAATQQFESEDDVLDYFAKEMMDRFDLSEGTQENIKLREVPQENDMFGGRLKGKVFNFNVSGKQNITAYQYAGESVKESTGKKELNVPLSNVLAINGDYGFDKKDYSGQVMLLSSSTASGIKAEGDNDDIIDLRLGEVSSLNNFMIQGADVQSMAMIPTWESDKALVFEWEVQEEGEPKYSSIRKGARVTQEMLDGNYKKVYAVNPKTLEESGANKAIKKGDAYDDSTAEIKKKSIMRKYAIVSAKVGNAKIQAGIPYKEFRDKWLGSVGFEVVREWDSMYDDGMSYTDTEEEKDYWQDKDLLERMQNEETISLD